MATVCREPVSATQSKPQSPCLHVWGWTRWSAGSPTALAEAYLLSEIPHLPWERPNPLSRAGPRGQLSEAASTLKITIQGSWPSHSLGLWGLSLCQHSERPPRLKGDPWEAGSGKCHEMDPPYSQTGGRGVGVIDPGEAKRSPEPWGQYWSNTIWGESP